MGIAVVGQYFPFVLLDMGGGDRTENDFLRMFAALHEQNLRAMREKTRYVLIATTRKAPSASERKLISVESNKVPMEERANTLVSVCIVSNPLVRGAITALGWLVPGLMPTLVTAPNGDAAVKLAASYLTKNGFAFDRGNMDLAARWLRTRLEAELAAAP